MMGSHLDTVRDAGKYDGMLGVITAIECVQALNAAGKRLPFAIEIVGFGDEEGVRFGTTLLGSRAVAGLAEAQHAWQLIRFKRQYFRRLNATTPRPASRPDIRSRHG